MKYALISGACGGLAQSTIKYLLDNDYFVFGLDKNEMINQNNYNNFMPFCLDITEVEDINRVYEKIKELKIKLDLIINFAGVVVLGSVIEEDVSKLKKILDVNVIGMYNINKAFFPLLNINKKECSRIINISSEYGVLDAIPFHSFYTMSKHAVEVYNDALRRELLRFGVKVVKIRPGSFKTNMQAGVQKQFDELLSHTEHYEKSLKKMKYMMDSELEKACNTEKFVKVIKKAITKKHPCLQYSVHNSFKMKLLSFLPDRLQDKIFAFFFK